MVNDSSKILVKTGDNNLGDPESTSVAGYSAFSGVASIPSVHYVAKVLDGISNEEFFICSP